jgi:hypothetical protein
MTSRMFCETCGAFADVIPDPDEDAFEDDFLCATCQTDITSPCQCKTPDLGDPDHIEGFCLNCMSFVTGDALNAWRATNRVSQDRPPVPGSPGGRSTRDAEAKRVGEGRTSSAEGVLPISLEDLTDEELERAWTDDAALFKVGDTAIRQIILQSLTDHPEQTLDLLEGWICKGCGAFLQQRILADIGLRRGRAPAATRPIHDRIDRVFKEAGVRRPTRRLEFHDDNCKQAWHRRQRNVARVPEKPIVAGDPGTDEWCADHGIDPAVMRAHGLWRYSSADVEAVKDAFREHLPKSRLGTVSRVVNQGGGLVMPKYAAPGFDAIAPQLRPDKPVIVDGRGKWQYHGPKPKLGEWPVFPPEAGEKRAGKRLPRRLVISEAQAAPHINRDREGQYDATTGLGDHNGVNVDAVHYHAPEEAKYVLLGDSKRIDVGPSPEGLSEAQRVFFVLEGKLKHLAVESAGEVVCSVASVTLWEPAYLRRFAERFLAGRPVFIVPDADWIDFTRNRGAVFRQAMYVRTVLRDEGIHAYIAAPPAPDGVGQCKCEPVGHTLNGTTCEKCGGYFKGVDDFLGAGGTIDNLRVLDREEPLAEIWAHVDDELDIPYQRRKRDVAALIGLSLHDRDGLLNVPLKTLQRIIGTWKPQLVSEILQELGDAVVIFGSLAISKQERKREDGTIAIVWDWDERPTIHVRDDLRAIETETRFAEFWQKRKENSVTTVDRDEVIDRIDLWGWAHNDRFDELEAKLNAILNPDGETADEPEAA